MKWSTALVPIAFIIAVVAFIIAVVISVSLSTIDNSYTVGNTLYWDDEQFTVEGATKIFVAVRPHSCWVTIENDDTRVESSLAAGCSEALTEAVNKFQRAND